MARVTTPKIGPSETGIYVAISSGTFKIGGRIYSYIRGQTFPAGHPLLSVRPDAFEPFRLTGEPRPRT